MTPEAKPSDRTPSPGALRAESRDGVLRVVFGGDWKRDHLGPGFLAARDEALRKAEQAIPARAVRQPFSRFFFKRPPPFLRAAASRSSFFAIKSKREPPGTACRPPSHYGPPY